MEAILKGLNIAQRTAVTSSASVLQVLAPPGSGKTKTLTSRVAYLLAHHGYAPGNVICCTFTIKASREMRERLRGMIGSELESKLILGTFHSICRRYLVTYGHLIGLPKNFGIADSDDSLNIIKRAVKRLQLNVDPRSARSRISYRKARGTTLAELSNGPPKSQDAREFMTIFREYEDTLATSNLLDYDDLLLRCVELLRHHPQCVSNIEALLIDEFQDTNVVQFQLMKLLACAKNCITIVGDPDQSIYGFRNAEVENLKRMKAFYPDTVVIHLEDNYRSSSAVLKLAQTVIEQDSDRPDKKLQSTHCYGTLPVLRRLPNPHEEARWVTSEIKRITTMTGDLIKHNDIAILLRSAYLSLLIEKALASAGIPYRMAGGRRFFDRVEVRILLDYLRCVSHPDNTSALLAIINTPARKVGETTVKEIMKLVEQRKETLWSVVQKVLTKQISLDKKLTKSAESGIRELVDLINSARRKMKGLDPKQTPGKLIEHIVKCLRFRDYLKKQYPEDHEERWENVQELITQATDAALQFNVADEQLPDTGIERAAADGPQEVLSRFLANVVLSTEVETNEDGSQTPRITISTIHSAKGLEWPVVFIPALYEGSIPHSRAEDTNEERRLLYVALTRAQGLLYMTFPVHQSRDENESILSQFLPSETSKLVASTGPVFGDYVVEELASIVRRDAPTQEALARGVTSVGQNESQYDDLWPADGSHRRQYNDTQNHHLISGQSIGEAMGSGVRYGPRSHYSTFATTTTMSESSSFSVSTTTAGFTTAGDHLRTMPQPLDQSSNSRVLVQGTCDNDRPVRKPPSSTAVKGAGGQGNLSAFFATGSFSANKSARTTTSTALQKEIAGRQTLQYESVSVAKPCTANRAVTNIPAELSNHRPGFIAHRRPKTLQTPVVLPGSSHTKRDYHMAFDETVQKENLDFRQSERKVEPASLELVSGTAHMQSYTYNTSAPQVDGIGHREPVVKLGPARLAGLNTLRGLQHPSAVTPLSHLNTGHLGRTLGVKRSVNSGWENRKHK